MLGTSFVASVVVLYPADDFSHRRPCALQFAMEDIMGAYGMLNCEWRAATVPSPNCSLSVCNTLITGVTACQHPSCR